MKKTLIVMLLSIATATVLQAAQYTDTVASLKQTDAGVVVIELDSGKKYELGEGFKKEMLTFALTAISTGKSLTVQVVGGVVISVKIIN